MEPIQPPNPPNVVPFTPGAPRLPGGGPVAPPAGPPAIDKLFTQEVIPLPSEGRGSRSWWKKELEASLDRVNSVRMEWENNLLAYRAKKLRQAPTTDSVTVPREFAYIEQKKSTLFFQLPDVHLTPLQGGTKQAVPIFQAVLNQILGEDEIDALATMDEVLFDALCPSGIMCAVIGFEDFQEGPAVPMKVGEEPDPDTAPVGPGVHVPGALPGAVLGLNATAPTTMRDVMEPVPNSVARRYFFSRLSPAQIRIPRRWSGSKYDRASWLAYDDSEDWDVIKRRFRLDLKMQKPASRGEPDKLRLPGEQSSEATKAGDNEVTYTVVWYHTSVIDPAVAHPEKFRQLVLVSGMDEPLVHRDSPFQWTDADGELMGLMGNPIHLGALRYVSDAAIPPSEASIDRALADENDKGRTQMIISRDRSRPMRVADIGRVGGKPGMQKLEKNIDQAIIGLPSAHKDDPPVFAIDQAHYPVEDFKFDQVISQDRDSTWGLGPAARSETAPDGTSATEIKDSRMWSDNRLDSERRRALRYYLGAVRKIGSLIQMFATHREYVEIIGADREPTLQTWDMYSLPGKYAYRVRPNSALRLDQASAQTQSLKRYELLRKDPNVNALELLDDIAENSDIDPKKLIVPKVPEKGPDQPNISFRFNAADLDVRNPNFPLYMAILRKAGYGELDEPVRKPDGTTEPAPTEQAALLARKQAQAAHSADTGIAPDPLPTMEVPPPAAVVAGHSLPHEHGGTAPLADHLNKHRADESTHSVGRPPLTDHRE